MCMTPDSPSSTASEEADFIVDTVRGVFELEYVSGSVVHVGTWSIATSVYDKLISEDFSAIVDPFGRPLPGQISVLYGPVLPWVHPPEGVTHVFSWSREAMRDVRDPANRLTFIDL